MIIGDKIKCINTDVLANSDIKPPLELNKEYTILNLIEDSKGHFHIDVGLKSVYNFIRSLETSEELKDGDKIHWCHPSRFEIVK